VNGAGLTVPAQKFALTQNVIVVCINYRLGSIGFWSLPGLAAENVDGTAGNFGLLDQQRALHWVQRSISSFGGDPSRVTIGGESAGALSVFGLLASPLSKGLFRGAIVESGNADDPPWWSSTTEQAFAWGQTAAYLIGCGQTDAKAQLACIRAQNTSTMAKALAPENVQSFRAAVARGDDPTLSAEHLGFTPYFPVLFPFAAWSSVVDGAFLTADPVASMRAGQFNKDVALLAGTNAAEGQKDFAMWFHLVVANTSYPFDFADVEQVLLHLFGGNATAVDLVLGDQGAFPAAYFPDGMTQFAAVLRDYFFTCSTRRALDAVSSAPDSSAPVYSYRFNYDGQLHTVPAIHTAEMNYLWDTSLNQSQPLDLWMSRAQIQPRWGRFIRDQDPSLAPNDWPRYELLPPDSLPQRATLVLDAPLWLEHDLSSTVCDMFDTLPRYVNPVPTSDRAFASNSADASSSSRARRARTGGKQRLRRAQAEVSLL
jgi:para-nitrobenzyl esterase